MKAKFKLNINVILPVALAALLPVLNLVSNTGWPEIETGTLDFFYRWLFAFVLLYLLWYVFQRITKGGSVFQWGRIIVVTLLMLGLSYLAISLLFSAEYGVKWHLIIKFLFVTMLLLIIQYALFANSSISRLELEKEQIQKENYKVQLEALRAKVDPHFLFNSLNTLRTMVRGGHNQSEQFVLSLADFYRRTLNFNDNTTIRLHEELTVLKSYLFLMKSRNEDAFEVTIQIAPEVEQMLIPTLALQSVVENCFKHNTMTSNHPLHILINTNNHQQICVRNNIQPKLSPSSGTGIGLKNLKRRYELLRISDGLVILQEEGQFEVRLKLFKP